MPIFIDAIGSLSIGLLTRQCDHISGFQMNCNVNSLAYHD